MGQKNTAIALGILASRASCLMIPEFSVRRLTTWRAVVTEREALPLVYHPTASNMVAMLPCDFCGRCAMKQYRGPLTRDMGPLRISSRPVSSGGGGVVCRSAVQSMTFRQNTGAPYMKAAIPPPVGGYPPPEHLHGVFAVIKPKGFSSADAVQKIKNILTKGVREELRARLASENDTVEQHSEHDPNADSGGDISIREETKGKHLNGNPPRRRQGPKVKVGHGGTLDPMATGVLVIGVGRGCRELSNYLKGGKEYRVEALLGHETDTQDAEGEPTLHGEWGHVTNGMIDSALGQFTGDIMQVPPMFSALRRDGQRLYQLARQGITVEREARPVRVHSLRQTETSLPLPRFGLEVECGGGFYVRTLVEDLGRAIGTRAHMTALERTKQGPFELEHALALDNWGYEELCEHLRETVERLGRCNVSAEDESSSNGVVVVATVPNAAAAAGK